MRTAIAAKDKAFDGQFYYGVITTGIFCRPSCTSRPAKPENIRFFQSADAAALAGFRPCKRCQPAAGLPGIERLADIARYIETHAEETLTLTRLADIAGLSPSRLQRIFKDAFGVSPKSYQDAVRMGCFKQSLKEEGSITDAIYSSGFGSISRVYGQASRNMGMTLKTYRAGGAGESITYACRNTTLGLILMAATDRGICFVQFGDSETELLVRLQDEFPKATLSASPAQDAPELDAWVSALDQHISTGAPRPDLPLDMRGTAFQVKVWQFLLRIQEGEVVSYGELAVQMNKPGAARAVASACAKNRIGVLIPCHRVLRGNGDIGGYRWGVERKQILLDAEKKRSAG